VEVSNDLGAVAAENKDADASAASSVAVSTALMAAALMLRLF